MAGPLVALVSEDPVIAEVVEHVLARHGIRHVSPAEAQIVVYVEDGAICVDHGGAHTTLGRPLFEHALVDAILAPGAHRVCVETVQVVLAAAHDDEQLVELAGPSPGQGERRTFMVRAAARRVLENPEVEKLLGDWLGGKADPGCVAVCAWRLAERLDAGDVAGAAALLWCAARAPRRGGRSSCGRGGRSSSRR